MTVDNKSTMSLKKDALLSELCSICYTETPKYRCPGCGTRTCSLPCVQRHKQRASCSGQRNPAAYLKRSQWATPAGIDQDYNYLRSVERSLDLANRQTTDRGIGGTDTSRVFNKGMNCEGLLQQYLIASRIHVRRAPQGMMRQKENQTRSTKSKKVMWTVEWIDQDDRRITQHTCTESDTLTQLHSQLLAEERNKAKRKRVAVDVSESKRQRSNKTLAMQTGDENDEEREKSSSVSGPWHDSEPGIMKHSTTSPQVPGTGDAKEQPVVCSSSTTSGQLLHTDENADIHFYLLKPSTTSTLKVLIPLTSKMSLTQALQGRTVLEYPTIYTLPNAADSLPPAFLNEEEYLKLRKNEEAELEAAIRRTSSSSPSSSRTARVNEQSANKSLDPDMILAMLKRDLTN